MPRPSTIALDLEGTLISSAISRVARPGLCAFLEFCRAAFERIVLFTAVPADQVVVVAQELAQTGKVPRWFADTLECVEWTGRHKDLRFVSPTTEDVLLLDDQEAFVLRAQKGQWIAIPGFAPPWDLSDDALEVATRAIERRLEEPNAGRPSQAVTPRERGAS